MTAISKRKRHTSLDKDFHDGEEDIFSSKKQCTPNTSSSSNTSISGSGSSSQVPSTECIEISDGAHALVSIPVRDRSTLERLMRLQRKTASVHYSAFPDPALCLNYADHIYRDFYEKEKAYRCAPYMSRQAGISANFRCILINWILHVHEHAELLPSVFWLAVNLLDRYLEVEQVERKMLQLVGFTALFIAIKFEEQTILEASACVHLFEHINAKNEVLDMELKMLQKLDFAINVPTGYHFLHRYLSCVHADEKLRNLASFYAERNLQEYDMLQVPSHHFAAAAVYAARVQITQFSDSPYSSKVWPATLEEETGLREADIIDAARTIVMHLHEVSELKIPGGSMSCTAVLKFSSEKYGNVATFPLPSV